MLSFRNGMPSLIALLAVTLTASVAAARSPLDEALVLEQQGKLKEARNQYHAAADAFRAAGDQRNLAAALSSAGWISISLGDYQGAIHDAKEALHTRQDLHEDSGMGTDLNTIGAAYQYLGNYPAALEQYQEALKFDRKAGDAFGEIRRLNNIGNVHYFQGRYVTALESYQSALQLVDGNLSQGWNARARRLTTANIATLYQRLGLDEEALELYRQNSGRPEEMPASEYLQTVLNEGVLYRHLGDPVKALEVYKTSQALFRKARYADGEIGALVNIGIAKAMDLDDLHGALQAFSAALELSQRSSNNRKAVQANLYLGEVLRRVHRYKEACSHLQAALESAKISGLIEERWKALYALGRIAEQTGSPQSALTDYREAISIIESVRAGLRTTSLRSDFLADKRDVYDSLIAFELRQAQPSVEEILQWMERSRARTLQDRVAARSPLLEPCLHLIQGHLRPDTVLIELWTGSEGSTAVWITPAASGMVRYGSQDDIQQATHRLFGALQTPEDDWKQPSRALGDIILARIPLHRHVIVVQDGSLNIPFEALTIPGSDGLLIEHSDVSYLPSARLLATPDTQSRRWLWPWNRQLVAIGDPRVLSTDSLAQKERWQPLPASSDEVRNIARIVPGRAEIHLGADARKTYLLDHHVEGVPLLHLSTHALVDPERPGRSRILLSSDSPRNADYLFQEEVNDLDLKDVGLVTLSACDTARGKMVGGEGVQAFSQSFLAAGASATISSMWKAADEPTASFMKQVYYSLAQGKPKAEALRAAKLSFLRSNSALASPRYWAAFVLTGDGWNPTARVISWSTILVVVAAALAAISMILWCIVAVRAATKAQRRAPQSA
jgi:tetratricopeptide (TPR) repeat protein